MAKQKDRVDALLDEMPKDRKPEEILGESGLLKDLTRRLVERALEGELTDLLGYEKSSTQGKNNGNSRNGKGRKKVLADSGEMEIKVPRDRNGDFEPQLVQKCQKRLAGFDEKVIALYARGMTTREIQDHLRELYGVEVSPTLISNVTDAVMDNVREWQNRPLEAVYPIVYLEAIHLKIRGGRRVETRAVYLALGVNLEGNKEVLGLFVGESEGAKFWLGILTELQSRGVRDILIACVNGLKAFQRPSGACSPKPRSSFASSTWCEIRCVMWAGRNAKRWPGTCGPSTRHPPGKRASRPWTRLRRNGANASRSS